MQLGCAYHCFIAEKNTTISYFNWLSISSLVKYRRLCVLHKIYMGDGTVLGPPWSKILSQS